MATNATVESNSPVSTAKSGSACAEESCTGKEASRTGKCMARGLGADLPASLDHGGAVYFC